MSKKDLIWAGIEEPDGHQDQDYVEVQARPEYQEYFPSNV